MAVSKSFSICPISNCEGVRVNSETGRGVKSEKKGKQKVKLSLWRNRTLTWGGAGKAFVFV